MCTMTLYKRNQNKEKPKKNITNEKKIQVNCIAYTDTKAKCYTYINIHSYWTRMD